MEKNNKLLENPEFGDTYRLIWRKTGVKTIGEVRNYDTNSKGYRRIHILLDDDLLNEINMRFLVSTWEKTGPKIYVSTAFMKLSQELREGAVWHEVGHIHYEHYVGRAEDYRTARISAVEKGRVVPFEEQADLFAIKQVGKAALIDFLLLVLYTRPTGNKTGLNEIGRRELEIRIATIRAFKTD